MNPDERIYRFMREIAQRETSLHEEDGRGEREETIRGYSDDDQSRRFSRDFSEIDCGDRISDRSTHTPQERAYWRALDTLVRIDELKNIDSRMIEARGKQYYLRDASRCLMSGEKLFIDRKSTSECLGYMCMGINYSIACMNLIESHCRERSMDSSVINSPLGDIELLLDRYCHIAATIAKPRQFFFAFVQYMLAPRLIEGVDDVIIATSETEAIQKLDQIKNWSGMELDPIDIITMNRFERKTVGADPLFVFLHDQPLTVLTQELRDEYGKMDDGQEPAWFAQMDVDAKLVFKHLYLEKTLSPQGRTFPAKLRKHGPVGATNAALHYSRVYDAGMNLLREEKFVRHAADALLTTEDDTDELQRTAGLSMRQIQLGVNKLLRNQRYAAHYKFVLNSPWSDFFLRWHRYCCCQSRRGLFDAKIVAAAKDADEEMAENVLTPAPQTYRDDAPLLTQMTRSQQQGVRSFVGNVGLNAMRRLDGIDMPDEMKRDISRAIDQANSAASSLLSLWSIGSSEYSEMNELHSRLLLLQQELFNVRLRRCALALDRDVNAVFVVVDVVQIGTVIDQMRDLCLRMNEERGNEVVDTDTIDQLSSILVSFGCASGNNRTGILMYVIDAEGLTRCFALDRRRVQKLLAESGHYAFVMGFQGSVLGTGYFREKSKDAHPNDVKGLTRRQLKAGSHEESFRQVQVLYHSMADVDSVLAGIRKDQKSRAPKRSVLSLFCCSRADQGAPEVFDMDYMRALFTSETRWTMTA